MILYCLPPSGLVQLIDHRKNRMMIYNKTKLVVLLILIGTSVVPAEAKLQLWFYVQTNLAVRANVDAAKALMDRAAAPGVGYQYMMLADTKLGYDGDTTINNIFFINSNTGFICSRKIFKTTNSGLNWYQVLNDPSVQLQVTGNIVYAISRLFNVNYLNKSTDLGETWSSASQGSGLNFSFHFINSETGWLSNGSVIRRTTNGGANWTIQPGTAISVLTMYFTDQLHGWAAGTIGSIIRTLSGGIGITPISSEIPQKFELAQNYPNPFNPVTKIRFSIPAFVETTRRVVSLKIYDVLGKEIAVLVNEHLKPGIYEINWNAENLPSGVYFYSLITNEFTQTKKMVVVK